MRSHRKIILLGFVLGLSFLSVSETSAQDRITIQSENGIGRTRERGEIIDFIGEKITFRHKFGTRSITTYAAKDIVKIETFRSDEYSNALDAASKNQYTQAVKFLLLAIQNEPRSWVKREMLALMVECQTNLQNQSAAGTYFLALLQSDPETRYIGRIPLDWSFPKSGDVIGPSRVLGDAREWMRREDPAAKLLGASCLLFEEDNSEDAQQELSLLSSHPRSEIRELAQLQLVRFKLQTLAPSQRAWKSWQKQIRQLPDSLRGGPDYLLGLGALQLQNYPNAVESFLWMPIVFNKNRPLSAQALLRCGKTYESMGQSTEAINLFSEIISKYKETDAAVLAKNELQKYKRE